MTHSPRPSAFGWFVILWAALCMTLLTLAVQMDFTSSSRIILLAMFLLAVIAGIERIRLAVNLPQGKQESAEIQQSTGDRSEHTRGSGAVPINQGVRR